MDDIPTSPPPWWSALLDDPDHDGRHDAATPGDQAAQPKSGRPEADVPAEQP